MTNTNAPLRYMNGADTITVVDPTSGIIDVATAYGTTTAAIQSAVNEAHANWMIGTGPTTAYLRAGKWTSTGTVEMQSGVTLAGAGREATIVNKTGAGPFLAAGYLHGIYSADPVPESAWTTDFTVRDLWVDCTGQLDQKYLNIFVAKGINMTHVRRATFRRVGVSNSQRTCIGLDYPSDHTIIDDCIVMNPVNMGTGIGGNGIGTMSGTLDREDFIVTNCTAIGCRAGVVVEVWKDLLQDDGEGARISGCLSLDCIYGFENAGVPAATFDSCIALGSTGAGFKFGEGDHNGNDKSTGAASMSNCFALHGAIGVHAYYDTPRNAKHPGLAVQGCTIRLNSSHGIYVSMAGLDVRNFIARGNTVSENGGSGIRIAQEAAGSGKAVDLSIVGNEIINNAAGGITLDADLTRGRVEGNNIIDTTGTAQTVGISVLTGRTLTGTAFDGGLIKATTPVSITGTLPGCHVGHVPGWTRGAGAPTVTAPLGTIYQRTDGAANTLLYVNTDGGTTWSAFA